MYVYIERESPEVMQREKNRQIYVDRDRERERERERETERVREGYSEYQSKYDSELIPSKKKTFSCSQKY